MSVIARFPKSDPPLTALVTAEFVPQDKKTGIKFTPKNDKDQEITELAFFPQGDVLRGDHVIARYISRQDPSKGLAGEDAKAQSNVDQWLELALVRLSKKVTDEEAFNAALRLLDAHLTLRTFFVGYGVTLADIGVWGALKLHPLWAKASQTKHANEHLVRWFKYVDSLPQFVAVSTKYAGGTVKTEEAAAAAGAAAGGRKAASKAKYQELEGAEEGKVVTRFPPEPSGYLHMGHVKAALLNYHYAHMYNGKLILRFDDTNPTKESNEFVDSITADLATLGIVPAKITYTSDYFDLIIEKAEYLIKKGLAYIDTTPNEELKTMRKAMIESPFRNQPIEESLRQWQEMKLGSPEGQKCVLRAKIDMQSKVGCMRDPNIFRVVLIPHHRTGSKYKVYPIYDFACPIVDSIEGVTHAGRSNEYHDRDGQYKWFLENLDLAHHPKIKDFSRLNFQYTLLSKRKLQYFVDKGIVEGWNSPAFPTLQGVLRRGLTVEALREFIIAQGSSSRTNLQEMEKLWALNKQIIDPVIPRYTAIETSKKVPFHLTNGPATPYTKSVPRHRKNLELGEKVLTFTNTVYLEQEDAKILKDNEEFTLMNWGNAIVRKITKSDDGVVTAMEGELHLEGDFTTTKWKLTWLPVIDDLIPVDLRKYGYLITKSKLAEDEDFKQWVNPNIISVTSTLGDPNLRLAQKGDRLQLERRGYFIVDQPYLGFDAAQPLVLIQIPDGHKEEIADTSSAAAAAAPAKGKAQQAKNKKAAAQ
ncbi:glutamine-tRNA ligase [Acanthamoeba castellanii str. Neff]|uniref:glutamate--tRNA ligase n=1 Tax=Acanthamoeba castellanii (strain ATCC 30010 / Neff) TaxID=1257118 RepID=L8GWR8_ACACF|nr:glutamine-tRNA ligase [Acanthamoeba castellanii str. Neff]ELR17023.1 glutamine-tRNA ligase [Acanthamoeba castellanii str. Neff]